MVSSRDAAKSSITTAPYSRSSPRGDWIDAPQNLIIEGPTGVGKSWLACALGHKACRDNR
jgi:DNA replication protein DnaC